LLSAVSLYILTVQMFLPLSLIICSCVNEALDSLMRMLAGFAVT
jgi:hypothetical protein